MISHDFSLIFINQMMANFISQRTPPVLVTDYSVIHLFIIFVIVEERWPFQYCFRDILLITFRSFPLKKSFKYTQINMKIYCNKKNVYGRFIDARYNYIFIFSCTDWICFFRLPFAVNWWSHWLQEYLTFPWTERLNMSPES